MKRFHLLAILASTVGLTMSVARAEGPLALDGETPTGDRRLQPLKDLNGYFPFTPPATVEAWQQRSEALRRQVMLSQCLWPMPQREPVRAVVHGRVDRDQYTVERVFLESYPGHFVTGNLYRPKGSAGGEKRPAVLCPHGHWKDGRQHDMGEQAVRQQIVIGAERFERGGRFPPQARCAQLARMGCVVFQYDMVGYVDSQQLAHRPGVREQLNTPARWGLYSPQAELRLQHPMALQSYNSVRALDFLLSLPEVDPSRVAVTGASGGGTQTFVLAAIDPRVTVSVPAVMVSTAMQGGCTCENASYLRLGSGNIELAGLFAPRPMLLLAADDWTREIETKGFPELQALYELLGAKNNVEVRALTQFKHNYNYVSRAALYSFLNQHLQLGLPEPIVEDDFEPLTTAEATVWSAPYPPPPAGDEHERDLLAAWTALQERDLAAWTPSDADGLKQFRDIVGAAWQTIVAPPVKPAEVLHEVFSASEHNAYVEAVGLLSTTDLGQQLPFIFLHPKQWNREVVIWIDPAGKDGLYQQDGKPSDAARRLLAEGYSVAGIDLLYQGEFLVGAERLDSQPQCASGRDNWTTYPGYTYGYNPSLLASRVHDILALVRFARDHEVMPLRVHLLGTGGAGHLAAVAAAVAGDAVDTLTIDTAGFRFAELTRTDHPDFVPGAVKYGDLDGVLALFAPRRLRILGEAGMPPLAASAYTAGQAADRIALLEAGKKDRSLALIAALLE